MRNTGLLAAIVVVAFGVTLAAAVISRLSDQTMTMLTGAACGAGLVVPFAILGGMDLGSPPAARGRPPAPRRRPPAAAPEPADRREAPAAAKPAGDAHAAGLVERVRHAGADAAP